MTHKIPLRERLIFALDVADATQARAWIARLGDSVQHYKLGLELLAGGEYFDLLAELKSAGKRVFADLKLHDIPNTVAGAVRGMARHRADLLTLHAYPAAIAAAAAHAGATRLLAVTVLTSMGPAELADSGVAGAVADVVVRRARAAIAAGAAGLVCSGLEAGRLREALGGGPLIVCPGIRATPGGDDQQRTVDVAGAFANGADYIVVGRPIRQSEDPRAAAEAIQQTIRGCFQD
ncbi:MAG: orotidine-5'-phosphate decarboxylase [Xanthomonadales bacterium]|nr:Orotidine 5'-phosphate decarboxylase [Xanthomonadales bacterium]MCC6593664.1 orotidine-5'-phosphate decarboxylase [Xanthomonadales bacterium]MCE7931538.1 orotidine-5'-phosphate decarboxylase [Xanthomonadales bacterium PRO6]